MIFSERSFGSDASLFFDSLLDPKSFRSSGCEIRSSPSFLSTAPVTPKAKKLICFKKTANGG
jgi:hypothetical protein